MVDQTLPQVRTGLTLGLSVSKCDDLGRYGVTEAHVEMALAEIARAVLVADGQLVYGGHLEEDGYTAFLVREIERFGRRNRPFTGFVPYSVHRRMHVDTILDRVEDLSVLGTYRFLDVEGAEIDPVEGRGRDAEFVNPGDEARALTAAREVMAVHIDARIALGGQRRGFRGRMPGVVEETIYAIRDGKPVFVAGGFGGVAADMAVVLGIDRENWLGVLPDSSPHLDELRDAVSTAGWYPGTNGLTEDEGQRLAITHRASEIASLVVTGLSRLSRAS